MKISQSPRPERWSSAAQYPGTGRAGWRGGGSKGQAGGRRQGGAGGRGEAERCQREGGGREVPVGGVAGGAGGKWQTHGGCWGELIKPLTLIFLSPIESNSTSYKKKASW